MRRRALLAGCRAVGHAYLGVASGDCRFEAAPESSRLPTLRGGAAIGQHGLVAPREHEPDQGDRGAWAERLGTLVGALAGAFIGAGIVFLLCRWTLFWREDLEQELPDSIELYVAAIAGFALFVYGLLRSGSKD